MLVLGDIDDTHYSTLKSRIYTGNYTMLPVYYTTSIDSEFANENT